MYFEQVEFSFITIPLIVFAAITGSVLFGSIASIISTRIRSSEGFNVIINTVFLFFAFVSTAFYPAAGAPEPLCNCILSKSTDISCRCNSSRNIWKHYRVCFH